MTRAPSVAVVVPTFRRLALLQRAIESVLRQSVADWELIVTDDEEPPGPTWAYIQGLAASDPRVTAVRNTGSHGQVGNLNNGLRQARAPWVKILYDDDVLRPDCLSVFLDAVANAPNVAVATCLAAHYRCGRHVRQDRIGLRPRVELLGRDTVHLALYLQDVDVGMPTQIMLDRALIDGGVLMAEEDGISAAVDSLWFARLLQHGDLLLINVTLVEEHQGEHRTVSSQTGHHDLDREFERLRELIRPMIPAAMAPPSLTVANQSLRIIRALHRLSTGRLRDAVSLMATSWHPRAWYLAARWFLRRRFPGRFQIVRRQVVME